MERATIIASASLAVSLIVLWLSTRGDRRARERSDVRWDVEIVAHGRYRIVNGGRDPAYSVRVELSDEDEKVVNGQFRVLPGEYLELTLDKRAAEEPERSWLHVRAMEHFEVSMTAMWRSRRSVWDKDQQFVG